MFPEKVTSLEFTYIFEKSVQFLNDRPLFSDGQTVISANDIVSAVGRCSPAEPWSGLNAMVNVNDDPTNRCKGMVHDLEKLNKLHKDTIANLAKYFMSRIKILNQPTSKRHRNSAPVESLQVGDIVVDKNRVMKSGSCVGALCRIAKLAPGNRVALVVHLKKRMKNNPDFLRTGKQGVFCKPNYSQPCGTCNHTQTATQAPLEVLPKCFLWPAARNLGTKLSHNPAD